MRNTPCECASAGWCKRHQCLKSEMLFQRCRRDQVMFRAWEDGNGPCISASQDVIRNENQSGEMQAPGIVQRVAHFGAAAARHVMSGFRKVSDYECAERLAICRACPSCDLVPMICREKTCGCYLLTKARWASESCPKGAWPPASETAKELPDENATINRPSE